MKKICSFSTFVFFALAVLTSIIIGGVFLNAHLINNSNLQNVSAYITDESVIKVKNNDDGTVEYISLSGQNGISAKLSSYNGYKNYTLTLLKDVNILDDSTWVPIGTEENPFQGVFDGNGNKITVKGTVNTNFQGVFGYASNAEFKNIQLDGTIFVDNSPSTASEIYSGTLLGYGNNVSISNCELISESISESQVLLLKKKTTVGGIVGKMSGGSIKNVSVRANINFRHSLSNSYTLKIGGVVGETNNTNIEKVVCFGDIDVQKSGENIYESKIYIGGIIGEMNSGSITDCVQGATTNVDGYQNYLVGAVIGNIQTAPQSGNISSIAYVQNIAPFAKQGNYSVKDTTTNDYVMQVPNSMIQTKTFYTSFVVDVAGQQFCWNQSAGIWDFDNFWVVIISSSSSQIRLQTFQNFTYSLSSPLDLDGRLVSTNQQVVKTVQYGDVAEFIFSFKDNIYTKYYQITEIMQNGIPLGFNTFNKAQTDDVTTTYTSPNGDIVLTEKLINENANGENIDEGATYNSKQFTITIKASNSTEGSYSFTLESIPFDSNIVAGTINEQNTLVVDNANGQIRYSGINDLTSEINRTLVTGQTITVEAVSDRTYEFAGWSLYYLTDSSDENSISYSVKGYNKFWGLVSYDINDVDESSIFLNPKMTINFGISGGSGESKFFNQEFLLVANFRYSPYTLVFNFDSNLVSKIEVNDQPLVSNSAILDKNESVSIKVYVPKTNTFEEQSFKDAILSYFTYPDSAHFETLSYTDKNDENLLVYEYNFSTSALKINMHNDTYTFSIKAKEGGGEKQNDDLPWIIGGVVGGVILLVAIGLIIWLVVRKRAIKSAKSKSENYKDYYY